MPSPNSDRDPDLESSSDSGNTEHPTNYLRKKEPGDTSVDKFSSDNSVQSGYFQEYINALKTIGDRTLSKDLEGNPAWTEEKDRDNLDKLAKILQDAKKMLDGNEIQKLSTDKLKMSDEDREKAFSGKSNGDVQGVAQTTITGPDGKKMDVTVVWIDAKVPPERARAIAAAVLAAGSTDKDHANGIVDAINTLETHRGAERSNQSREESRDREESRGRDRAQERVHRQGRE